jgi:hypothetical protein
MHRRQVPDLRVQHLQLLWCLSKLACTTKHLRRGISQLLSLLRHLRDRHVELQRNLDHLFSPRNAANATFALNADMWLRQGILLLVSAPLASGSIPAQRSSFCTCHPVNFPGVTSGRTGPQQAAKNLPDHADVHDLPRALPA